MVGLSSGVATVAAGGAFTCALMSSTGEVRCWGKASNGQLGDGTTSVPDTLVSTNVTGRFGRATELAVGDTHACAVLASGGVACWGDNAEGQLGDGTTQQRLVATAVVGLSSERVAAVRMRASHTCALLTTGGLRCWGKNADGQLGDGTTTRRLTPVAVSGFESSGVAGITAGDAHTCALLATGGLRCWGQNVNGQLGDGTTTQRLTPVAVSGFESSGVAALSPSAGSTHNCALLSSGAVRCWGSNSFGQLGDGTKSSRLTATPVTGLSSTAVGVSTNALHTCAVLSTGGAMCWGHNYFGQLGSGTTTDQLAPIAVVAFNFFPPPPAPPPPPSPSPPSPPPSPAPPSPAAAPAPEWAASYFSVNAQGSCPSWQNFTATITQTVYAFSKVRFYGSNAPSGRTCLGAQANVICRAMAQGQSFSTSCGGYSWAGGMDVDCQRPY